MTFLSPKRTFGARTVSYLQEDSEPQEQGATALFGDCESLDEAKYLLEHLYNFCVAQVRIQ